MKFILIFTVFLSLSSFSSPHELAGKFSFSKKVNKLSASVVEPVYAFTAIGRTRLADLKQDGYSCKVMPRQTYRCKKFDDSFSPRTDSLNRIIQELQWENIEFIGIQGQPYLASDAQALTVYEVEGRVRFMGVEYERYEYLILKSQNREIHKLVLRGEESHEFIVHSSERLTRVKLFSNQEKKRFFQFLYEGEFTLF